LVRCENLTQQIFENVARDFVVALCLFVWLTFSGTERTLVRVRHLLCCGLPGADGKDPFQVLLSAMIAMEHADDGCGGKIGALIARGAATMRSGENRTGGNPFRTSAMRATSWLDLPRLAALCDGSTPGAQPFILEDLKTGKGGLCVAIVAPVTDIRDTYSGFVRALTVMTGQVFQNIPGSLKVPCAVVIDEAPSLGKLEFLEVGTSVFRKYGLRIATGSQDLPAIQATYPTTWRSFISNAGATLWMGANENDTLRYISETLGNHTRREMVEGAPWYHRWIPGAAKISSRYQHVDRALLDPQQVKDLLTPARGMMIVTSKFRPFVAAIDPYWQALPVWRYQPDPFYRETLLRSATRRLLSGLGGKSAKPLSRPSTAAR
jgi:type IV secretory pathway TraG/TraD family ATPase VirD4